MGELVFENSDVGWALPTVTAGIGGIWWAMPTLLYRLFAMLRYIPAPAVFNGLLHVPMALVDIFNLLNEQNLGCPHGNFATACGKIEKING